MEIQIIAVSAMLMYANLGLRISSESALTLRLAYLLCVLVLLFPILTQATQRKIKKTPTVIFAILAAAAALVGMTASLFMVIPLTYSALASSLLFLALTTQNNSIAWHCLKFQGYTNLMQYRIGLIALCVCTIGLAIIAVTFAMITFAGKSFDVYLIASIGFVCHAVGVFGVRMMRRVSAEPK